MCCSCTHCSAAMCFLGFFRAENSPKQLPFPSVLWPHLATVGNQSAGKQGYVPALQCHSQEWSQRRLRFLSTVLHFPPSSSKMASLMGLLRGISIFCGTFSLLPSIPDAPPFFSDSGWPLSRCLPGAVPLSSRVSHLNGDSLEPDIPIQSWGYSQQRRMCHFLPAKVQRLVHATSRAGLYLVHFIPCQADAGTSATVRN